MDADACPRGPLISVDGVTGIGKTYLTGSAVADLDPPPLLLEGFSQRTDARPDLGRALLRALVDASGGDRFLRGGRPLAETMLLLAIKRHDLDTVLPVLAAGRAVIEGRGVDTTAVCQAIQLQPDDRDAALSTALALRDFAASYRPLPDVTIIITDDPETAISRAQDRDQRTFTSDQVAFMRASAWLFEQIAATDPTRYRVLDRRDYDEFDAALLIRHWVHDAGKRLSCLREPWTGAPGRCLCCHAEAAAP
jgi:dTMP kinase